MTRQQIKDFLTEPRMIMPLDFLVVAVAVVFGAVLTFVAIDTTMMFRVLIWGLYPVAMLAIFVWDRLAAPMLKRFADETKATMQGTMAYNRLAIEIIEDWNAGRSQQAIDKIERLRRLN